MESTLSKIVLPYGVTVHSTTSGYMNVPDHKYKRGSAGLLLKPGPCKVQASYAGPEQVEVRLYGTSGKRNTYGLKRVLEVIPSGGGSRLSKIHTIGAVEGDWVQMQASSGSLEEGHTGTIEVFPIPDI